MITKSIITTVYIIIMTDQQYVYCINDKLYNLSDFVNKHPGGTDVFYNLKPQIDITPMIYSYHKDVNVVFEVLSKYEISTIGSIAYKTNYKYEKYKDLKRRVYNEIRDKALPLCWSTTEVFYNMGGFAIYILIWVYCGQLATYGSVSLCWFLLLATINIGHCALIFHETSHYTGFKNQQLNTLVSYIAVAPILTTEEWKWDHNYLHHGFTNSIFDADFNGHQFTLRHSSEQPHYFQHRFQHLYVFVLLCLGGFSGQIDSIKHKRFNILLFLFILYWFGFYPTLTFYSFTGFLFLMTAQLSHIQPECVSNKSNDFLEIQVTSAVNYRTTNFFSRYFCFGLDIQIEHHLFPNIPHSTLRQIQPIIRAYCHENGISYIERANVFETAKTYWQHLYKMSLKNE